MHSSEKNKFPLTSVILFLAIMAVSFSLTLSKNQNEAEDAIAYVHHVTEAEQSYLFHPNHLIYNYINLKFYQLWKAAGYKKNALVPMQVLNVISSLTTLAIFAFIGWKLGLNRTWILLSMFTLVSCFGYWWYSVEVEAYLIPLPFALTSWYLATKFIQSGNRNRLIIASICIAIAILIHQQWTALFVALCIALLIHWWRIRNLDRPQKVVLGILAISAIIIGIVTLGYWLVIKGHFSIDSTDAMLAWIRGEQVDVSFSNWSYLSPFKAMIGALRAVWGGHFIFGFEAIQQLFVQTFPDKLLMEEIFLAKSLPPIQRWILVTSSIGVTIWAAIVLALALFSKRSPSISHNKLDSQGYVLTGLPIILIFFCLNSIVEPTNSELYIGILPIAVLLLVMRLSKRKRHRFAATSLGALSTLLLATNLTGSILPQTNREHDYWYVANQFLINEPHETDLVISQGGYINDAYLRLFSKATVERGTFMTKTRLEELYQQFKNDRIFVSSWTFSPPSHLGHQIEKYDPKRIKQNFSKYELKAVKESDYQTIYQLTTDQQH